jgi:hypothetical protein
MCTVSFIPSNGRVHLTSNRDEKSRRKPAALPDFHMVNNRTLLFPKDTEKGGTWIAVKSNGDAAVLLNGALLPHLPGKVYRSSRGFVIPRVLSVSDAIGAFTGLDLNETEPFTLILYQQKRLYECRWDGKLKTILELSANEPHIWSSVTLYSREVAEKRKEWFQCWMLNNPLPDTKAVVSFHHFTGSGNKENDLVMNRSNETLTVSITSVCIDKPGAAMTYLDLVKKKRYAKHFYFSSRNPFMNMERWKRLLIRLQNWEYWSFHIVYAPIYFYWLWLCLKARSFFFFNAANPAIRNGGFLMESKKEIYDLLPEGMYPHTLFIPYGTKTSELAGLQDQHDFQFPLIAKPDIGLRGLGVKKICSMKDLIAYHEAIKVDYLVQSFIPYTKEVGIFYYRLPGQKKGVVTGIVGKELLRVKGNGKENLEELLKKENRFFLQLPALRRQYGTDLSEILPNGEEKIIVPYGNHSRGAKFLDISDKLTPELFTTINDLCKAIPGFYFGRLDIKYDNWDDLCAGRNLSIIELNGSGSEPAHIYDPKHSLMFAWKEIIRHLRILYMVSKQNKKMKKLSYLSMKEGVSLLCENSAYLKKIS